MFIETLDLSFGAKSFRVVGSLSFEQLKIKNKNESKITFFMVRDLRVNKYYVDFRSHYFI